MSDPIPDPPDVVAEAIQGKTSISDIAGKYARKDKTKNRLVVRVYRYLKRMPGGEKLKKYLLNDGSWHRLNAAARLTCSASQEDDEDPIIDLMAQGGVPIVALSRGADEKRKVYSYWYAQVKRNRPQAIDYMLDKEAPALQLEDPETEDGKGSTQFFDIDTHEFSSISQ
jgi:hypothetical protein